MSTTTPTVGQLPDALAYVKPSRTEFWLALRTYDDPKTVSELEASSEYSSATIYRMLDTLSEHGLAEQTYRFDESGRQQIAYHAVDPTDGGDRQ